MEILDTGATTGVPPRGLDTRQSFPDPVPEDVGVRRQWLSCRISPAHLQHGAQVGRHRDAAVVVGLGLARGELDPPGYTMLVTAYLRPLQAQQLPPSESAASRRATYLDADAAVASSRRWPARIFGRA